MNACDLLIDSSQEVINFASKKVRDDQSLFDGMVELVTSKNKVHFNTAFHVILKCTYEDSSLISPHLQSLLESFISEKNEEIRKGLLKLLLYIDIPDNSEIISLINRHCFDIINSKTETCQRKIDSLNVLFKVSKNQPLIRSELFWIINEQIYMNSPEFRVEAEKLLEKLMAVKRDIV